MLVKLKAPWFAPTEVVEIDRRKIKGRRFKKGIQEIPEELRPYLPSDAKIVHEKPVEEKGEEPQSLKDLDLERAAADDFVEAAEQAEKTLKERRQEQMAKARAAKKAKQEKDK